MDEYIKREAYYQRIDNLSKGKYGVYCAAINDCMNVLDEQPTVDVVEVVRCMHCQHFKTNINKENYCDIHSTTWDKFYVRDDDYCSYGRRIRGD